jgi:transglutaminase-like putative cysteine protease
MQATLDKRSAVPADQQLFSALPLYAASLVVTLAGVGAVGVTITAPGWTPLWVFLTVLGHAASIALRRLRVPPEAVFVPVMLIGSVLVIQQLLIGSTQLGMDTPLFGLPVDMATAVLVGSLAVLRTFTLVSNAALLFSPVPAITMLALVGSSNPNAEVPLFFGLLMLGSLFITGYEAHLQRVARTRRQTSPLIYHLLTAWSLTLLVAAAACIFALVAQPVLGPFSPFALSGMSRLPQLTTFTQMSGRQAPIGQGPIRLSRQEVFEIYAPEGDLFRTGVFSNYTGGGWTVESQRDMIDIRSDEETELVSRVRETSAISYRSTRYLFRFKPDPDLSPEVPTRDIRQAVKSRSYNNEGIPALGRILELRYPKSAVYLHGSGAVSGSGHILPERVFELVSRVPEYPPYELSKVPALDPRAFDRPETLSLPNSTLRVQELAQRVTAGITSPYERVQAILGYIEKNCRYTLQETPTPPGEDAVTFYLFRTRMGACDLSASAAAIMCRSVGIPARVAVGYVAEEPLPGGGGFLIRQEHAHMWLEAFFPGFGWVTFNPSPPMARVRENLLEAAWLRVRGALTKIGGGGLDAILLVISVLLTLLVAAFHGWVRLRQWLARRLNEQRAVSESPGAATALLYNRALRILGRRGWRREEWMTSREYLDLLRREWTAHPESVRAMETLTDCFQRAFYGGNDAAEVLQSAAAAFADLSRASPRRERRRKGRGAAAPAAGSS